MALTTAHPITGTMLAQGSPARRASCVWPLGTAAHPAARQTDVGVMAAEGLAGPVPLERCALARYACLASKGRVIMYVVKHRAGHGAGRVGLAGSVVMEAAKILAGLKIPGPVLSRLISLWATGI
jgi:hypothetical protein